MTISKADRDLAIVTMIETLAPMIAERRKRDAVFASGALKRSDKYCAFFATAKFATLAVDYKFDICDMMTRCDKTLDRFVRVIDAVLLNDTLTPANDRDQNRYTFNLARTLIGAANASASVTKSDVFATASKTDTAPEYVNVSRRVMSESTADRQSGIAVFTLELLGFLNRTKNADGSVAYHIDKKSKIYRKILAQIASGK